MPCNVVFVCNTQSISIGNIKPKVVTQMPSNKRKGTSEIHGAKKWTEPTPSVD